MAATILVLAEHRDGELKGITREAMTCALDLAPKLSAEVHGVVLGQGVKPVADELAGWGASKVLYLEDQGLGVYTPESYVAALRKLVDDTKPALVLCGHSYQAIDYFPRLAAALDAPFIPDCTSIVIEDGQMVFTRQVINGKLDARCTVAGDGLPLVSLQQGAFPAEKNDGAAAATVETLPVELSGVTPREILKIEEGDKGEVDLSEADVIVAGGRGVGAKEKFQALFDLADLLGASVGASRPPCDAEWVEHVRQIGSSGQVVAPKLYFAVGISGAIQHLVGMRGSQCVVAINKDANAAIFQEATYGLVGDLHEILPALIDAIKETQEG